MPSGSILRSLLAGPRPVNGRLGGLTPDTDELSAHLASRREVGEVLLASGVPTTVLRAAVILGSGSASFEMMRAHRPCDALTFTGSEDCRCTGRRTSMVA